MDSTPKRKNRVIKINKKIFNQIDDEMNINLIRTNANAKINTSNSKLTINEQSISNKSHSINSRKLKKNEKKDLLSNYNKSLEKSKIIYYIKKIVSLRIVEHLEI